MKGGKNQQPSASVAYPFLVKAMQSLVDEFLSPELKSNGIELGAIAVFGPCNKASGNT